MAGVVAVGGGAGGDGAGQSPGNHRVGIGAAHTVGRSFHAERINTTRPLHAMAAAEASQPEAALRQLGLIAVPGGGDALCLGHLQHSQGSGTD